jgi:hypothetical protein
MDAAIEVTTVIAQIETEALAEAIRGLVLPLVLVIIGVAAIAFLFTNRATGLIGFLAVGIFVVFLLTNPEVITDMAEWFGELIQSGGSSSGGGGGTSP